MPGRIADRDHLRQQRLLIAENLGSGLAFPEICTDEWIATDQFPLHRTSDLEPAAEVITYQRRGIPEFSR